MPDSNPAAELLEGNASGTWVGVDVVMKAFGIRRSAAYKLASSEGWRATPARRLGSRGPSVRQYAFDDVARTWRNLRTTRKAGE